MRFIPYGRQSIGADDEAAVLAALRSDYLTTGPAVERFEAELAAHVGARRCVAVSSGTAALHLAMAALDLGEGEGITSPITFVATANAMDYVGLEPVFADIDPDTLNLSVAAARAAMSGRTRLLAPVHFAGLPADMAGLAELAGEHGLRVVEDAAHAIGSEYPCGARVGSNRYGDLTAFSFHPVKSMTTGEGGAVTTNDDALYERLLALRAHGVVRDPARMAEHPGPWWHEQQALGFNYRLTDIQAALGSSQLGKLEGFAERRRRIAGLYRRALAGLPWLTLPYDPGRQVVCPHLFVLRIDFPALGLTRTQAMERLAARGVGSQVHYIPVPRQPWRRQRSAAPPLPAADAYYDQALSIPLFPAMTDEDALRVVEAVRALARAG